MPFVLTPELRAEYARLFATAEVMPLRRPEIEHVVERVASGRERYAAVGDPLRIPWYFVGLLHSMEADSDFTRHLHNGDPLEHKTVHAPSGRPVNWPPLGWDHKWWEMSARDALIYDRFHRWHDWSPAGTLYSLELYNGLGYRKHQIPSPYLWAGSQHYTAGKYIADGVFSRTAVSRQIGAGVVLRRLVDRGIVEPDPEP